MGQVWPSVTMLYMDRWTSVQYLNVQGKFDTDVCKQLHNFSETLCVGVMGECAVSVSPSSALCSCARWGLKTSCRKFRTDICKAHTHTRTHTHTHKLTRAHTHAHTHTHTHTHTQACTHTQQQQKQTKNNNNKQTQKNNNSNTNKKQRSKSINLQ